ncbi:MAG: hypothetical protein RBS24_06555 [Bacilli bacterium]|nr:hypothetical protein [Bacilli bacterium]
MFEQEYISKLESDLKEVNSDLIKSEALLGLFAKRHYADGLSKAMIIKLCNDYFNNKNKRYEEN